MTDWQPIETAPKDGTIILVNPGTWRGSTVSPAKYAIQEYEYAPTSFWLRLDAPTIGVARKKPPTHWIPMPEAPK